MPNTLKKTIVGVVVFWIILFCLVTCITGCGVYIGSPVKSNEEISPSISSDYILGIDNFNKISNGLYYDSATKIVYLWNGQFYSSNFGISPTPYYSPNGLLYRYIPETNTLEEINPNEINEGGN